MFLYPTLYPSSRSYLTQYPTLLPPSLQIDIAKEVVPFVFGIRATINVPTAYPDPNYAADMMDYSGEMLGDCIVNPIVQQQLGSSSIAKLSGLSYTQIAEICVLFIGYADPKQLPARMQEFSLTMAMFGLDKSDEFVHAIEKEKILEKSADLLRQCKAVASKSDLVKHYNTAFSGWRRLLHRAYVKGDQPWREQAVDGRLVYIFEVMSPSGTDDQIGTYRCIMSSRCSHQHKLTPFAPF